ncbi:hypothetical protein BGX30_014567 [Mortierella sp. GBA39]|nr:hypothetical protein BGX30_014567 [Mortierella sp. GBA39]
MATNQHTATQLAVSIPFAPGPSSSSIAARYPAPEPQEAPVPVPPVYVAGSTSVSTPTSGMHSPPLSGTLEEEANEKRAAHVASNIRRSQPSDLGKTATPALTFTTPSSVAATATSSSGNSNRPLSSSSRSGRERRGSPSVTSTTSKTAKARPGVKISQVKNQVNTQMHSSGSGDRSRDSNSSSHSVGLRTAVDHRFRPDLHQVRRPLSKEKTIEHVLQQGKILKLSRRLRTRLEYAILKIRRGWTKYTLQEVESLIQPVCSPRITPKQIHQSISLQSSPLLTERRRVKHTTHQRRLSDPARIEKFIESSDIDMPPPSSSSSSSSPSERFRSRMPSLSQFKDSELFLPAKSLMEIATSKPEPGYLSPYLGAQSSPYMSQSASAHNSPHSSRYGTPEPLYRDMTPVRENWSGYSSPARVEPMDEDEQDDNGAPSDTQAARTILMLSSPTRPAPRTLNQNYITEMHSGSPSHSPLGEWTAPYSPMTSSPLVHFQTMDSTTPSPDRTPTVSSTSTPSHLTDRERGASPSSSSVSSSHQRGSSNPSFRLPKQTRSSSPTLKRAVRFAAEATQGSLDPSGLSVERIKDKITGLTGRGEYNSTADMIYPGSQPGQDDKKEYSPAPNYAPPAYGETFSHHHQHQRDITPPPPPQPMLAAATSSSNLSLQGPGVAYNYNHSGQHGMRTPPPSGGKDMDMSQYSTLGGAQAGSRSTRMRRDSGMAQAGKTDDLTTLLRRGAPSSSSTPSSTSPSSHPGSSMHRQ